ncbi:MAG: hypothetical protein ACMXYF_00585 [Candidatus Woesearchaeota archaeon]
MRYLAVLFIVSALLVAGCGDGSRDSGFTNPFIGGSKALDLRFQPGAPVDEIQDAGNFPFGVTVEVINVGESDIDVSDGYIKIDGISPEDFGVTSGDFRQELPPMRGATKSGQGQIINGDRDAVSFGPMTYMPRLAGSVSSVTVRALACYNYETRATTTLCVKSNPMDPTTTGDVCDVSGPKRYANSAGPIRVVDVVQNPSGRDGIQVALTIQPTSANNNFYRADSECTRQVTDPNIRQVYVEVEPILGGRLHPTCRGFVEGQGSSGFVRFSSNTDKREIYCTFDVSDVEVDAEVQMDLSIKYRYEDIISKPILIRSST